MNPRRPAARALALAGRSGPFIAPGVDDPPVTGTDTADAGDGAGVAGDGDGTDADGGEAPWSADPPSDRLGWEAGYWDNESVDVDQSDVLNESERAALVGRTMARVEVLRELEFEPSVSVEVVSRAEFRNESPNAATPDAAREAWNEQVWEALLLVGEDRTVADAFDGDPTADTVGEASLFAALWAARGVDRGSLYEDVGPYSAYNYDDAVTAGWAGDAVVPYRTGVGEDAEYGCVLRTAWDTEADAREFYRTYTFVLGARLLANRTASDAWVVESGPFADAFRVTRDGRTVTVVNAPSAAALDAVHRHEST